MQQVINLLNILMQQYCEINSKWQDQLSCECINLKRTYVSDLYHNSDLKNYILLYRNYLELPYLNIMRIIQENQMTNVTSRLKLINSIEYKIDLYMNKEGQGHFPINKCLNDLRGFRIILDNAPTYQELTQYIDEQHFNSKYDSTSLKCINSTKNDFEYHATHIYIRIGNKTFPWEIQIWDRKYERKNKISHKRYKQAYTNWESELKEITISSERSE